MFDPGVFDSVLGSADCTLCTRDQVKTRLFPAGPTDTNDDGLIDELIAQVSDWIEDYTHRKLCPDDGATYVFDTEAGYVMHIPRGIRAVTSMGVATLSHQPDTGGTYTTIPAGDILLRPKAQDAPGGWPYTQVRISRAHTGTVGTFATIENGCTITGNFGFAATPPAIQAVAIDAVVAAYQSRKSGASGVIGAEDSAVVPWVRFFSKGSPQRATLDRYRHWAV
jgi:hypothetical protein